MRQSGVICVCTSTRAEPSVPGAPRGGCLPYPIMERVQVHVGALPYLHIMGNVAGFLFAKRYDFPSS